MLRAGQVVAGRYLLESAIGEGAMGAVFRAHDQTLKRQVAIKFLFVRATRDPQAMVDQFLREARIAASVQHRNVIHTVDFGTIDQLQPFMVMELLHGESLADRMARAPALSHDQLVHLISLTLRGLAAVHDAGIVHRDLKPQNIFLQRDADAVYPKILDFGISRSVEQSGERRSAIATQEGLIVGTPDYMSPEQARGEPDIDRRSDIYSMGVILYEGLSGSLPFDAANIGDLIVQIMTKEPPTLRELDPAIPASLSDLVAQAMAKKREHRFTDARELRRALLAAAEQALPQARRIGGSVPPEEVSVSLKPRAAAGAATWGDFEGLKAAQLVDRSEPLDAPVVASPAQKQRLAAGPARAAAAPAYQAPAGAPSLELDASEPRRPAGRAGQAGGRKPRKTPAAKVSAEQALDPLYAGAEQAAPDIDYDRVHAVTGPSRKAQVGMQERGPLRRRGAPLPQASGRVRLRGSWVGWVLPVLAIGLIAYLMAKPAVRATPKARPGTSATQAVGAAASQSAAAVGSTVARVASQGALEDLRLPTRVRRKEPGSAPVHMRDVVF